MRWTSSAGNDKITLPRRERFSTVTVVLGTFSAFMLLLALLFPEERLLDILGRSYGDDAATIRYIEAMLRVHPEDFSLRLRLVRSLMKVGAPRKALEVLNGFRAGNSASDQRTVLNLRYRVLKATLQASKKEDNDWRHNINTFAETVRQLSKGNIKEWELRIYAADAREVGDLDTWKKLVRRADALAIAATPVPGNVGTADPYALALGRGDYRAAAEVCFDAMKMAMTKSRKRELYFKGVRVLQSGNMPVEALDAGERNLGGLSDDRETLMFLTRVGLAAGKPERAQRIIRRALKMNSPDMS
jgi:hypothetical protein